MGTSWTKKEKKEGNWEMTTIISAKMGLISFGKYAEVDRAEELTLNMIKPQPRKLY